jgi:caffeoyl-CoA O-methyltransferase
MTDKQLTYLDKLFPNQPAEAKSFNGTSEQLLAALLNASLNYSGAQTTESRFKLQMSDRFSIAEMGSNPLALRLLELLVRVSKGQRVLEIGTFIGVSAMAMAEGLRPHGKLVTVEKFPEFAEIARTNFKTNHFDDRIDLIVGDAFECLSDLKAKGPYDFIFLDGNKERYDDYFRELSPLLAPGGLFVTDDVFFHGDVFNTPPTTEKGQGVLRFLEMAKKQPGYFKVILPVSNGIMVMLKN